jgi:ATP-binding cassette subfamily B protein
MTQRDGRRPTRGQHPTRAKVPSNQSADSALKPVGQKAPLPAPDRIRRRTVIAIAHRLSTLRNFDRAVVLRSGRVALDDDAHNLIRHDLHRDRAARQPARRTSRAA